jgi:hypothetical protein
MGAGNFLGQNSTGACAFKCGGDSFVFGNEFAEFGTSTVGIGSPENGTKCVVIPQKPHSVRTNNDEGFAELL